MNNEEWIKQKQKEASGHTPLNPLFRREDVILRNVENLKYSTQTVKMVMPFTFYDRNNKEWLLPYEPLVSVSCENKIISRNVAKQSGRGTIKERWGEGDVKITIEGTFVNDNINTYPSNEVQKLRDVLTQKRAIMIENELLSKLNVQYIVVQSWDLPFTKGENAQNYSINALSDDAYNLFIEVK